MNPQIQKWLKLGLSIFLFGVVIYLFWPLLKDIRDAAKLFATAQWGWLLCAVFIQLVSYHSLTWLNLLTLKPFTGQISFYKMMAVLTTMAFVETAIPSAGASGVALRALFLRKHGRYSVEAAIFSLGLESVYIGLAMLTVSISGVVYLLQTGKLTYQYISIIILVIVGVAGITWGAWHLLQYPDKIRRLLAYFARVWNRWFGRFRQIEYERLEQRWIGFQTGLENFKEMSPWPFLTAAFIRVGLDVVTLGVCFLLFGYGITIGRLFTGYGLMLLLSGLASLPGGLGLADASVPVIFSRLGAPGAIALVAGLTYRLIAFWLLRFIGFVNWQVLDRRNYSPE